MTSNLTPRRPPSSFDLRGRRAVVTGVSAGIGSSIAVALAAAGAHVAGIYKTDPEGAERTEAESRSFGVDTLFVERDTVTWRRSIGSLIWWWSGSAGSTSGSTTRRG